MPQTDTEYDEESNPTKSEYTEKQRKRDEQIDRAVGALETASIALMRASGAFILWLFEPERPSRVKRYARIWAKLMAVATVLILAVAEYAYWRAPAFVEYPTIFLDMGFMQAFFNQIYQFGMGLATVLAIVWLLHQAAWEWTRDKREWLEEIEDEEQMSQLD